MRDLPTRSSLLLRLSQQPDDLAWAEFAAEYGELLRRIARRRGLQTADVDDIVQDVYLKLTRAMPGFVYDRDRGRFRGFLKTVVNHAISDRFRQNPGATAVPLQEHLDGGDDPAFDDLWDREWRANHVRRAMRTISVEFGERDRLAFDRLTTGGQTARIVAEALGMTENQVYKAKSNIMRRLGELVAAQVEEEG